MQTVAFRLETDLVEQLKAIAEKEKRTFAGQIRYVLSEYINNQNPLGINPDARIDDSNIE